jgi:hypothetical protein
MADFENDLTGTASGESVAYWLFRHIAAVERRSLSPEQEAGSPPGRAWILDTYAECLETVRNPKSRLAR